MEDRIMWIGGAYLTKAQINKICSGTSVSKDYEYVGVKAYYVRLSEGQLSYFWKHGYTKSEARELYQSRIENGAKPVTLHVFRK